MDGIWRFVEVWWWLVLLVLAQGLVRLVVVKGALGVRRVLDRRIPDDLPQSAGEWVGAQLQRLGLAGEISASPVPRGAGAGDSYFPGARLIGLAGDTWFKHDPAFWAIGAHELGHALTYRTRLLGVVFVGARVWAAGCIGLGTSLILINMLFGSPLASQLARTAWLAGVGGGVIVVIDEAIASLTAMHLLREDGRLSRTHMWAAAASLASAWFSYAGALAAQVIVVVYYDRIAAHIEQHHLTFEAGESLGTAASAFAVVASLLLILYALALVRRVVQPRSHTEVMAAKEGAALEQLADAAAQLALCGLLLLVWDRPDPSDSFVLAFALAAYAARSTLGLLTLPFAIVFALLLVGFVAVGHTWLLEKLTADGPPDVEPAQPTAQQEAEAEAEMERAEALLTQRTIEVHNGQDWHARLGRVTRLAYLPLLFVLWFSVA